MFCEMFGYINNIYMRNYLDSYDKINQFTFAMYFNDMV